MTLAVTQDERTAFALLDLLLWAASVTICLVVAYLIIRVAVRHGVTDALEKNRRWLAGAMTAAAREGTAGQQQAYPPAALGYFSAPPPPGSAFRVVDDTPRG